MRSTQVSPSAVGRRRRLKVPSSCRSNASSRARGRSGRCRTPRAPSCFPPARRGSRGGAWRWSTCPRPRPAKAPRRAPPPGRLARQQRQVEIARPLSRARSSPRPSIGQDRRVLERAAEIGLVGVAQVVLEVEVRLGAREVIAKLLVRPRVLGVGLDVLVRLHDQIDLRLGQLRLAADRLQHPGEHLVEVGERRRPLEAEFALQHRTDARARRAAAWRAQAAQAPIRPAKRRARRGAPAPRSLRSCRAGAR